MPLEVGSRIGPYEVIAPLGAGGMGEVYRARDPRIGRDVAIKVLPPSFASDPGRLGRFEQEARSTAAPHFTSETGERGRSRPTASGWPPTPVSLGISS